MALQERRAIKDTRLLVRSMIVLALVIVGFCLHSVLHVAPSIVALLGAGTMLLVTNIDVAEILPGGRVADAGVLHGVVRDGRGSCPHRRDRMARRRCSRDVRRQLLRRGHRVAVRLSGAGRIRRQHSLHRHHDSGCRRHGRRRRRTPKPAAGCGGRSRSAPASAATAPRSRPAPTSSPSASPSVPATRSVSGGSPATASW